MAAHLVQALRNNQDAIVLAHMSQLVSKYRPTSDDQLHAVMKTLTEVPGETQTLETTLALSQHEKIVLRKSRTGRILPRCHVLRRAPGYFSLRCTGLSHVVLLISQPLASLFRVRCLNVEADQVAFNFSPTKASRIVAYGLAPSRVLPCGKEQRFLPQRIQLLPADKKRRSAERSSYRTWAQTQAWFAGDKADLHVRTVEDFETWCGDLQERKEGEVMSIPETSIHRFGVSGVHFDAKKFRAMVTTFADQVYYLATTDVAIRRRELPQNLRFLPPDLSDLVLAYAVPPPIAEFVFNTDSDTGVTPSWSAQHRLSKPPALVPRIVRRQYGILIDTLVAGTTRQCCVAFWRLLQLIRPTGIPFGFSFAFRAAGCKIEGSASLALTWKHVNESTVQARIPDIVKGLFCISRDRKIAFAQGGDLMTLRRRGECVDIIFLFKSDAPQVAGACINQRMQPGPMKLEGSKRWQTLLHKYLGILNPELGRPQLTAQELASFQRLLRRFIKDIDIEIPFRPQRQLDIWNRFVAYLLAKSTTRKKNKIK